MKLTVSQMETIAALSDSETFKEAGHKIGRSDVLIGRQVKAIEKKLNRAVIFRASSRRLALTNFGKDLSKKCIEILMSIDEVSKWAYTKRKDIGGVIKVLYHDEEVFHATLLLLLGDFCMAYPAIDLHIEQAKPLIKHGRLEADIYWCLGNYFNELNHQLGEEHILSIDYGLFASPNYLARYGEPKTPDELNKHATITSYSRLPSDKLFLFNKEKSERFQSITARNRIRTTNHIVDLAVSGLGVINAPANTKRVDTLIQEGKLVEILKPYWIRNYGMKAYYDKSISADSPAKHFLKFFIDNSDRYLLHGRNYLRE